VRDPGDTRLELEDEGVCLLIDFKEALEKEKWRSEIVNTKQQLQARTHSRSPRKCAYYSTLTATPPLFCGVCVCVCVCDVCVCVCRSQEDEINKALKSRPKRRQRPGELQREQSMFINKDNLGSTPPCNHWRWSHATRTSRTKTCLLSLSPRRRADVIAAIG